MSKMLEAALAYAGRGWPVFPCRVDKTPYTTNGVLDATTDPKVITRWFTRWPKANIGFAVGEVGMMSLDYDPGADRKALKQNVGDVPETHLAVATPRDGEHAYYLLRDNEIVSNSASKLAPAVDVRSHCGYTLLPPSRTADGEYTWIEDGKPAFRTDEMVRLANSHRDKSENRDKWIIEPDLPENIELARDWLSKKAKIATEGQGGDHIAYATAAMMKSHGLSPEMAFELMWEVWNPRCDPPWSEDEIDHFEQKVHNGYSYNTSPPGNVTPGYKVAKARELFAPVEVPLPSGRESKAGRYRFVDRQGMTHIKPPNWLIPNLLVEGSYAIMFGASQSFKTFIALDIALNIATGGFTQESPWSRLAINYGPVLFAVGEGRPMINKRVQAWEQVNYASSRINPASNFILSDPVPHVAEELEPFINGARELNPDGYRLVVLDTIGRAMQGINENQQENASAFTAMVEAICRELNCTVLALHHTGVDNADRERGSSVFGADADTRLLTKRAKAGLFTELSLVKQKDASLWDKPVTYHLREVNLGEDQTSLVAVKPDLAAISTAKPARDDEADKRAVVKLIDDTARTIMEGYQNKEWSGHELARVLGHKEEISVGSARIRTHYLRIIREDPDTYLHAVYDPERNVYRR